MRLHTSLGSGSGEYRARLVVHQTWKTNWNSTVVTRTTGRDSRPIRNSEHAALLFGLGWHLLCSRKNSSLGLGLERDRSDDHLVVDGGERGADEGADPEDPLQTRKFGGYVSPYYYYKHSNAKQFPR